MGWYYYQRDDHAKTRHYYEQVFARRVDNPYYFYSLAAVCWAEIGEQDKALAYIQQATQRGWAGHEYAAGLAAFNCLHDRPEWTAALAQMVANGEKS